MLSKRQRLSEGVRRMANSKGQEAIQQATPVIMWEKSLLSHLEPKDIVDKYVNNEIISMNPCCFS